MLLQAVRLVLINGGEVITDIESINELSGNSPTSNGIYAWNQKNGQSASTTGTIYGIYDMNGGLWERTASFVDNGNTALTNYGNSIYSEKDRKYVMKYISNEQGTTDKNVASQNNYLANSMVYGNAIQEVSTSGTGNNAWGGASSVFVALLEPMSIRGASLWYEDNAGLLSFHMNVVSHHATGFRVVLINE